ncbi:unnamed protein product [Effrenium voratum]|nr:unnamed protein product [Effrenium voratum]
MSRQRSAEVGIEGIVDFMRTATKARYPSRVRLYKLVHSAAQSALAEHFERMALIGSTALRIDTPDSDLDVVVYTRAEEPLNPVEALRKITEVLKSEEDLKLQLVDCARVPVLTVLSEDGRLSLDLTVDQPLGEWHVLWFQSLWQWAPLPATETLPPPMEEGDDWASGLEATALRCIKWWLRRRNIPVSKEGGYPTVVWTLMVLHVLRCSVFVDESKKHGNRALLGAIAAFFDRFASERSGGTLSFCMGPDGMSSAFHPQYEEPHLRYTSESYGALSVLDPTTTCEQSIAWGVMPSDLAPPLPPATRLLHSYELRRAQRLSAQVLSAEREVGDGGGQALEDLFTETSTACNTMPAAMPSHTLGVMVLRDGELSVGLLTKVWPKPGWTAPFLHRRDTHSAFCLQLCEVRCDGLLTPWESMVKQHWFKACDFVCLAGLQPMVTRGQCRGKYLRRERNRWKLDPESLERWHQMYELLAQAGEQH